MDYTIIKKYFPVLTSTQEYQFSRLEELYQLWNEKINVISRKDVDFFYERHVLHSLAIAKVINFQDGSTVLDIGTGGGFPGIPLAILFPKVEFTLVDSIGKKITVVDAIKDALEINNVTGINTRAENIQKKFDFIISRAVTQMPLFLRWVKGKLNPENHNVLQNGILYLKGGDLTEELKDIDHDLYNVNQFFEEDFFETKKIVYVNAKNVR